MNNEQLSVEDKLELINKYEDNKNILLNKISKIFTNYTIPHLSNINDNVFRDLNIYYDSNNETEGSIFNTINYTQLLYGQYLLRIWIKNPTLDTKLLKQRQSNIKCIVDNLDDYVNIFSEIKFNENKILWFWDDVTEEIKSLYDMVYFDVPYFSNFLNNNELVLNSLNLYKIFGAPIFSVFIPILTFIIPYILLLIYNKNISFTSFVKIIYNTITMTTRLFGSSFFGNKTKYFTIFMTGIYIFLYIQSGYSTIKQAMDTHKVINTLHRKINYVTKLIRNTNRIREKINDANIIIDSDINDDLNYFNNLFSSTLFDNDSRLFNNKGKILAVYQQFLDNKDKLINILKYLGEVDVYIGLAQLYNSSQNNKYCFVKYISKRQHPYLYTKDSWHPSLKHNPKMNSISLGNKNKNILVTGPNKAGKSIFIKSLAINVLFAQTIGIVNCSKCIITPMNIIDSYLHIPDSTGHASLFEAEMCRARDHIERLKLNKFAFIIMDEIFTSTNYIEGYSAAYAISKKLSTFKNSISIITTHFTGLNKLEKETNGKIKNYKFSIDRDEDGKIIYNYKLEKGYSKQYVTLELLKEENFDEDIINDALKMCKQLQKLN